MKLYFQSFVLLVLLSGGWSLHSAMAADKNLVGDIRIDVMADKLELDEDQLGELDKLFKSYQAEMEKLELEGDEVRRRLHNMDLGAMGYGQIIGMSREMGRIVSEQTRAMLETQSAFYRLLTPEQQVSLSQFRASDREERERRLRNQMGQGESVE